MSMTAAGWPSAAPGWRPALGQQQQPPAVGQLVRVDVRPDPPVHGDRLGGQRLDVHLDVEVAGVGDHRAVAHGPEVLRGQHVAVAGGGDEDVPDRRGLRHRQHPVAVQHRLERPPRLDLGHDDLRDSPRARAATPLPHQP
jgi:hypothetical protein